jgi:hypothetical protein
MINPFDRNDQDGHGRYPRMRASLKVERPGDRRERGAHTGLVTVRDGAAGSAGPGSRARRVGRRTKKHRLLVLLVLLVAVLAGGTVVGTVSGAIPGAARAALDASNPYRDEYGGLAALRIGIPADYVESLLGRADSVDRLCEVVTCPTDASAATATVRVYRSEHAVVRAVFRNGILTAYLVTTTARDFTPRITWLGVDFGRLGRVTFEEVLPSNGAPEPSDASVFPGPGTPSYAEVLMGGGPSRFRGFLLGSAPDGYRGAGMEWNADAARDLATWQRDNPVGGLDPDVASGFRSGSMPNTFGAFRDDGPLKDYFRDAENVRVLLSAAAGS